MSSPIRLFLSLLIVAGGVALIGVGVWLFIVAKFIYTDGYHTQRQMYSPNELSTWRETLDYLGGLLLWSIPALIVGLPGFGLAVLGFRRFATTKNDPGLLQQPTVT